MKLITPLPCPFCGGVAKRGVTSGDVRDAYADTVFYKCIGCGVSLGATGDTSKGGYANNSKIEKQALEKWNTRTGGSYDN